MKKVVIHIMASTGIIVLALSVVALLYGGKAIFIHTIFEIAVLSTMMHLGFLMTHRLGNAGHQLYPVDDTDTGRCFPLVSEHTCMGINHYGFRDLFGWLSHGSIPDERRGQDDQ